MLPKLQQQSITWRLTISLIFSAALVSALIIGIVTYRNYIEAQKRLAKTADEYSLQLTQSLGNQIWNIEQKEIQELCSFYAGNDLVTRLNVVGTYGKVFYHYEIKDDSRKIERKRNIFYDGNLLGTLDLALTTRFLRETNAKLLYSSMIILLVTIITLMLLTGFFLRRYLKHPLTALENIAKFYSSAQLKKKRPDMPYKEFEQFVKVLDKLNTQLNAKIEEHKDAEEKFRGIFENALEGIFQSTREGRFIRVNPSFANMAAYDSPEEMIRSITDIGRQFYANQKDRNRILAILTAEGRVSGFETQLLKKDGTLFWGSITARVIKDRNQNTFYYEGMIVDTTQKRDTERVEREKRAAEAANKAKSEFLANMSHEIRTPMNAILGMAELLWESPLNEDQRKFVEIFQNAGDSLLNIINDILDLSKVEAGQLELEALDFDLEETIERVCDVLALKAHEKKLELILNFASDVPQYLIGDPNRLRQILSNLIGNAVKFTNKGEIEVKCEAESIKDGIVKLLFSIRDSGIGISEEACEKIFSSFSQADSSTTRQYGGTGLGLAICKSLAELMGGTIWVESDLGKGSTFYFSATFEIQSSPEPVHELEDENLKGLRVLIVDDNATHRLIFSRVLSEWGLLVRAAASGPDAIEWMHQFESEKTPFDLVLLDGHMPDMDGYETAREIKRHFGHGQHTAMMVTSDDAGGNIAKARAAGIRTYLVKPVKRKELKNAIKQALGSKKPLLPPKKVPLSADTDSLKTLKILLVEDNFDNQQLFRFYLKKTPHGIAIAKNGQKGVDAFIQNNGAFDIVFMDKEMPVMDGNVATRNIRKWEQEMNKPPIPIVSLTAHAMKGTEKESYAAGCTDYLSKPFKKSQLLGMIEKHCYSQ